MPHWSVLEQELSRWSAAGRAATLWWRDDDAGEPTAALHTLLELSGDAGVGVALATVPAAAGEPLAVALASHPSVAVVQHGWAHVNHLPPGMKACEFGDERGETALREELERGAARLRELFGRRLLPVFVPPWNRIGALAVRLLPALGVRTLSTFQARPAQHAAPGVLQVNCHADLVDWKGSRGFVGTAKALAQIVSHLEARRTGGADADEPTGVLTHHLAHDAGCWQFMRGLLERTHGHPGAAWLAADAALCPA